MGEFQKRFKHLDEIASEDWWPELEHMMEVVEEAKKEFPFAYFTTEGPILVKNPQKIWKEVLECVDWFEKWFSETK